MFAVILGMSAIAPAMASKPNADVDHRIIFCHYQEAKPAILDEDIESDTFGEVIEEEVLEAYLVIETDKKGKMNGHFKGPSDNQVAHHFPVDGDGVQNGQGDFVITNDDEDNNPTEGNDSVVDCEALNEALG
jgi:hypothetical protein